MPGMSRAASDVSSSLEWRQWKLMESVRYSFFPAIRSRCVSIPKHGLLQKMQLDTYSSVANSPRAREAVPGTSA
jgi:undecaprenyl pyrophosphate phosphatase UppP